MKCSFNLAKNAKLQLLPKDTKPFNPYSSRKKNYYGVTLSQYNIMSVLTCIILFLAKKNTYIILSICICIVFIHGY